MPQNNSSITSEFLDQNQYTDNSIRRYEFIFGRTFVSTGGLQTTQEFCSSLNLRPDELVLDVGVGAGGSAIYMAKTFGVHVKGVDLSSNMLSCANDYKRQLSKELQDKLEFIQCDITTTEFPENSFDVIYSRDTLLHILDKETLFKKFYQWLRPGGRVLISDYNSVEADETKYSVEFKNYLAKKGYFLIPMSTYSSLLKKAGFPNVQANDVTKLFIESMETELQRLRTNKVEFLKHFSSEDYSVLEDGWTDKILNCSKGEQKWGLFSATKQ